MKKCFCIFTLQNCAKNAKQTLKEYVIMVLLALK